MLEKLLLKKLEVKYPNLLVSGILCGFILGVFSIFSFVMGNISENLLLNKVLYSMAFTTVLFAIMLNKYDLFTGNTMSFILLKGKKMRLSKILANLGIVYTANFIGCFLTAVLIFNLGITDKLHIHEYILDIFVVKTGYSIVKLLILGFFANFFVCMAVFNAAKEDSLPQKYLGLFFPIFIFCLLGFEHSIANMFSLSFTVLEDASKIWLMLYNLLFVTIGNIFGGVVFALSTRVKEG